MKRWSFALAIGVAAALLCGCATGISARAREQVTFQGTFEQLILDPSRYRDEIVLLGGKVIDAQVAQSGSDLLVLQLQLDTSDQPVDNDRSSGRFLIRSDRFVDPALYPQGQLITVVGRLRGVETKLIDQLPYQYPVVELIEIKAWPKIDAPAGPRFHIGFGFGTSF
jgi:outer membrane lipoprotein